MLSKTSGPIQVNERLELIDILRTFALLGIFIVNIQFYQGKSDNPVNITINWLIQIFIQGSFYPLFSLLFGIGFMIFLNRARVNEKQGNWLYIRRLFFLLIIATMQFVLLEPRHILFKYVALGLPLIAFQNASKKVLVWSISVLIIISVFHSPIINNLHNLGRNLLVNEQVVQVKEAQKDIKQQTIVIEKSNWEEFTHYVKRNAKLLPPLINDLVRQRSLPRIFTFFLLGVFIWQSRVIQRYKNYLKFFYTCLVWGGLFGIIGNIVISPVDWNSIVIEDPTWNSLVKVLADSALTLSYISGIALLTLYSGWIKVFKLFSYAGRMGLTNYLLQSLIMSLLFLNYGLGLKNELGALECTAIAVISTILQIIFSIWWLQKFKYGPVEWIWRIFTYGKWLPNKLQVSSRNFSYFINES